MTRVSLNLLGTCFVRYNEFGYTSRYQKDLSISRQKRLLMSSMRVRCGIFLVKNKQLRFSWSLTKVFIFSNRRKNQFKMLLEMCIIQRGKSKFAFRFQLKTKIPIFTTVRSAKLALTCRIVVLRIKNQHNCCLEVMIHIALHSWQVATVKNEIHLPIWRSCPPITIKHTRMRARKGQTLSIYGIIVSTPHWLIQWTKNSFPFSFYTLSVYSKETWLSQSPTTVSSDLLTLDQIQLLWMREISSKNWPKVPKKFLPQLRTCCCLEDKTFWFIS